MGFYRRTGRALARFAPSCDLGDNRNARFFSHFGQILGESQGLIRLLHISVFVCVSSSFSHDHIKRKPFMEPNNNSATQRANLKRLASEDYNLKTKTEAKRHKSTTTLGYFCSFLPLIRRVFIIECISLSISVLPPLPFVCTNHKQSSSCGRRREQRLLTPDDVGLQALARSVPLTPGCSSSTRKISMAREWHDSIRKIALYEGGGWM